MVLKIKIKIQKPAIFHYLEILVFVSHWLTEYECTWSLVWIYALCSLYWTRPRIWHDWLDRISRHVVFLNINPLFFSFLFFGIDLDKGDKMEMWFTLTLTHVCSIVVYWKFFLNSPCRTSWESINRNLEKSKEKIMHFLLQIILSAIIERKVEC